MKNKKNKAVAFITDIVSDKMPTIIWPHEQLHWAGSTNELVEIIAALNVMQVVRRANGSQATQVEISNYVTRMFNCPRISKPANYMNRMKERKNSEKRSFLLKAYHRLF